MFVLAAPAASFCAHDPPQPVTPLTQSELAALLNNHPAKIASPLSTPISCTTATATPAPHYALDAPSSHSSSPLSLSWHPMDLALSSFRFDFDRVQSSPAAATLADSMHAREFETQFCRDFHCCGLRLFDLHELLQHYEECHVRFEDDIDDDATTSDNDGLPENESDVFDDDSWSDPDSAPASPSSQTAPAGSTTSAAALETLLGGGGSSATRARMAAAAAASTAHLYPAFQSHYPPAFGASTNHNSLPPYPLGHPQRQEVPFIHSTHPLYRHPSEGSSVGDVDESYPIAMSDNNGATAHALDAFAASFHGPIKRKAAVSLADIYANDYDNDDDMSKTMDRFSAFSNTTLGSSRSNSISSSTTTSSTNSDCGVMDRSRYASDPLIPLSAATNDRFTLESNRRSTMGSIYLSPSSSSMSQKRSNSTGSHPFLGSSRQSTLHPPGVHIGPLSKHHVPPPLQQHHHYHRYEHPLQYQHSMAVEHTGGPYIHASATDLMRQTEEVFNLVEDLSRTGNVNTGDKPYRCTMPGCDKAYKNPNGLKYHNLHGHCTNNGSEAEALEARPYVCTFLECGKRYKNLNGLKYHIEHSHPNLTAALRAHQSGLINPHMFGTYPSQAAMTIAAALQAVNSSPMMMVAVNAIMAAQAATATANHVGGQGDMGASSDDSGHGIGTGTGTGAGTGSVGRAGMVCEYVSGLPGPLATSHMQRYGLDPGIAFQGGGDGGGGGGRGCGGGGETRSLASDAALDAILTV